MNISEFNRLKEQLYNQEVENIENGIPVTPGLWMDYENNQGERRQFRVINITSSPYYGCFEADCFSDFRFERIEAMGYQDEDMATTSHRTFKIANIISAKIC
jgi:hypothetical protein